MYFLFGESNKKLQATRRIANETSCYFIANNYRNFIMSINSRTLILRVSGGKKKHANESSCFIRPVGYRGRMILGGSDIYPLYCDVDCPWKRATLARVIAGSVIRIGHTRVSERTDDNNSISWIPSSPANGVRFPLALPIEADQK